MERESLLLGSSSGCLLLYNVEEKTTQIVGRLEGGVSTIASSPDGALISVTTGFGQLLVITQDWEVLFETSLDPQVRASLSNFLLKAWFLHVLADPNRLLLRFLLQVKLIVQVVRSRVQFLGEGMENFSLHLGL